MFSNTFWGGRDTGQWLCEAILFYFWTHTRYIVSPWTNISEENRLNISRGFCDPSFTLTQLGSIIGYGWSPSNGGVEVQLHTFLNSPLDGDCHLHSSTALLLGCNTGGPLRESRNYGEEQNLWPCQALKPDSRHIVTFLIKLS